jgi:hypothetical protein
MPYLICIGKNEYNKSRISCKGYCIYRRNKTVFVEYGSIDVIGDHGGHYYWAGPNTPNRMEHKFTNKEQARLFALEKVKEQTSKREKSASYIKLPPNIRIRSNRFNPLRKGS